MKVSTPRVVIAGAGSGKTHQMILEIINIIPELKKHPEKFCAIITYTNSATEEIKNRISKVIGIPSNLHISTTHSFLTKFIIDPYAHLYGYLPIDKNYIEKIVLPFKAKNFYIERACCIKKATELSTEKGLVIYDKILETAFALINNNEIANQVSNRLSYIFVDEYQDMRLYQHYIFQTILKHGKTNFYCIGDPLQSIFNFSYGQSQLSKEPKPNNFQESPLLELSKHDSFKKDTIEVNNRSSNNIITFINNFNQIIGYRQEPPVNKRCNEVPIYFIVGKDKTKILEKFDQLLIKHNIQNETNIMFSLLISEHWNMFEDISAINSINNENSYSRTIFSECTRVVLGSLGINKTSFLELIPVNDKREKLLQFRKFCFSILKDIRNPHVNVNSDYIIRRFNSTFKIQLADKTNKNIDISKGIDKLKVVSKIANNNRYCSSIHTSKGLESTSVLVLARTNKQLLKWLDFQNVIHDKDDDYRLGYVAFSRAREILCLAVLEEPIDELFETLKKLNIQIAY